MKCASVIEWTILVTLSLVIITLGSQQERGTRKPEVWRKLNGLFTKMWEHLGKTFEGQCRAWELSAPGSCYFLWPWKYKEREGTEEPGERSLGERTTDGSPPRSGCQEEKGPSLAPVWCPASNFHQPHLTGSQRRELEEKAAHKGQHLGTQVRTEMNGVWSGLPWQVEATQRCSRPADMSLRNQNNKREYRPYNGHVFNQKKEWSADPCSSREDPWQHHA